jgi:hypothetical protein
VIDGTVAEWLVVFNGRTEITGTVGEDVVVFNWDVVLRSGSRVGGDVISLEDPQIEEGATIGGSVDDLATRWNLYDITFGAVGSRGGSRTPCRRSNRIRNRSSWMRLHT